jgi:hypothetical protein
MALFSAQAVSAVLAQAVTRIALPSRWSQGAMARTALGVSVAPESAEAVAFCAYGALRAEALGLLTPGTDLMARGVALTLAEHASKHLGVALVAMGMRVHPTNAPRTVMEWNDTVGRSHDEVLWLYGEAQRTARRALRAA